MYTNDGLRDAYDAFKEDAGSPTIGDALGRVGLDVREDGSEARTLIEDITSEVFGGNPFVSPAEVGWLLVLAHDALHGRSERETETPEQVAA